MALFFQNILSFPVSIFSVLLIVVTFYWLIASLGLFDIDSFDMDGSDALDGGDDVSGGDVSGLLMKLGLSGVPITIIITFITLFGWMITYASVHYFLRFIDTELIRYALGTVVLLVAFGAAIFLTSIVIRPLRPLFNKINSSTTSKMLVGQTVEIRSSLVTSTNGQANYEDGGAGMILQVRAADGNEFKRGDRAVILSYDETTHSYLIISEDEFKGI